MASLLQSIIHYILASAVNFAEMEKTISESEGSANITLVLSKPIAPTSQVTVVDDKGICQMCYRLRIIFKEHLHKM